LGTLVAALSISVILSKRSGACRETEVDDQMLKEFLADLTPRFNAATYDLLKHNCNHFSNELAELLVGTGIPVRLCARLTSTEL
jgi:hypothetical protein